MWRSTSAALRAQLAGGRLADADQRDEPAPRAATSYLRRPDLGRAWSPTTQRRLLAGRTRRASIWPSCVGDGLSALAVQRHAPPLLAALRSALRRHGSTLGAVGHRDAGARRAGDEIGARCRPRVVLMLIGERPGLSSPDSLGVYLTHAPRAGRNDAERNCITNIRPDGLAPAAAAERIAWLMREALRRGTSGVALKDDSATALLTSSPSRSAP